MLISCLGIGGYWYLILIDKNNCLIWYHSTRMFPITQHAWPLKLSIYATLPGTTWNSGFHGRQSMISTKALWYWSNYTALLCKRNYTSLKQLKYSYYLYALYSSNMKQLESYTCSIFSLSFQFTYTIPQHMVSKAITLCISNPPRSMYLCIVTFEHRTGCTNGILSDILRVFINY